MKRRAENIGKSGAKDKVESSAKGRVKRLLMEALFSNGIPR